MPDFRQRRGFTLIELLIVMVIVGVLILLAVPRIGAAADRLAVRGAVSDLSVLFATARDLAVARRTLVAVVIDTASGSVSVRARGSTIIGRSVAQAYAVRLAVTRDSMSYDPRGLGYGAANLSVAVQRGSAAETLFVSRLGRARP